MDSRFEIPVETLRRAAELLLSHLQAVEGPVVALDADYFWAIPARQRNNVDSEPTDFTVGQLTESFQNLSEIVEGSSPVISYALVWLADILRAAGEVVVE